MQTQNILVQDLHSRHNNPWISDQNSEHAALMQKLAELELQLHQAENTAIGYKIELQNSRKSEAELLKKVTSLQVVLEKKNQQLAELPI